MICYYALQSMRKDTDLYSWEVLATNVLSADNAYLRAIESAVRSVGKRRCKAYRVTNSNTVAIIGGPFC